MMVAIPPGKGGDWEEREQWTLHPPSMSDRNDPRPPGGTFTVPPVDNISVPVPRNASADHATRDVYNLVAGGGTPQPPEPPEPDGGATVTYPWDSMTTHAQIDAHMQSLNGDYRPEGWVTMTIAQKKAWLLDNHGVPA